MADTQGWTGCWQCGQTLPHEGTDWMKSPRCRSFQRIGEQAFDQALAAVTSGVQSAKAAHAEHGHRDIVSSLVGLELAIPKTENPYRAQDVP